MDDYYPPIKKSSIKQIYPWPDCIEDHFLFILFLFLSTFVKKYSYSYIQQAKKHFSNKDIFFLNSGRSALLLALISLGIKEKDKVIITAFNCPAVIDSILNIGAEPVFVDVNYQCGFDIDQLKEIVKRGVKAIIVTHVYGIIDNIKEIEKICQEEKIITINDLAQVSSFFSNEVDNFGDVQIYSFGPEKPIFALNLGVITTKDKNISSEIFNRYAQKSVSLMDLIKIFLNRWKYYFTFFIHKNLSFLVDGLAKYKLIYQFKDKKTGVDIDSIEKIVIKKANPFQIFLLGKRICSYKKRIKKTEENFLLLKSNLNFKFKIIAQDVYENVIPNYATIRLEKNRFSLSEYLAQNGIATVWNYYPLYKYTAYSRFAERLNLNETERAWKRVLSLPFKYPLSDKDIIKIANLVNDFYDD